MISGPQLSAATCLARGGMQLLPASPLLPPASPHPTAALLTRVLSARKASPGGPRQPENNFSLFDFSLTVLQGKLQN